jgi:peptidoglycan hydrolase-like protein with peptidoglycan-binding domain
MAVAGQGGLDPRQVKAREEFQKMREQLRRALERTSDPAPWRERAPGDVSTLRLGAARRPLHFRARAPRRVWKRPAVIAAAAFVLGIGLTVVAVLVVQRVNLGAAPETEIAGVVFEPPTASAAAPSLRPMRPSASEATSVTAATEAAPVSLAASDDPEVAAAAVEAPAPPAPVVSRAPVLDEPQIVTAALETPAAAVETPAPRVAARIEAATPEASGEDPVVARIGRIREAQTLLAALGYPLGRADGAAGPQTLAATAAFAEAHELSDSNFDAAFLAALRAARSGALATPGARDTDDVVLARVTRVREAQLLLSALGYEAGRADGDAGPLTLQAAASFAERHGLEDANLDEAFLALLREDTVRPR